MKTPLKILGIIFSVVASLELVALAVFWLVVAPVAPYEAKLVLTLVLGIQSVVFGSIGFGFLAHIRLQAAITKPHRSLKPNAYTMCRSMADAPTVLSAVRSATACCMSTAAKCFRPIPALCRAMTFGSTLTAAMTNATM